METPLMPIGVCILNEASPNAPRSTTYPHYIKEILDHAGICYEVIPVNDLFAKLAQYRMVVTVGEQPFAENDKAVLTKWLSDGGAWISVGGVCGMNEFWKARAEKPLFAKYADTFIRPLGEGWMLPNAKHHPVLNHIEIPLHYFNGLAVKSEGAETLASATDKHQKQNGFSALLERDYNKGYGLLIAIDLTGSVVKIQQGIAVTRDGDPAPDGTAPVNDGVLKTDDGCVLDWEFDRQPVAGADNLPIFTQPIADQWRELLIRALLHAGTKQNIPIPVLWYYPRNLPAIAHMSHDTDNSIVVKAYKLMEVIKKAEIKTTWCVILPAYPKEVIEAIKQNGFELATHYDSQSDGKHFSQKEWNEQYNELLKLFGEAPTTNKNHFLRWEGDTDMWEWLIQSGIQVDQCKGPSKAGNVGFTFGSCHPYFPVKFDGSTLNIIEIPTLSQDLIITVPPAVGSVYMKAALKAHGICHVLFHPQHVETAGVEEAILNMIAEGKKLGMEWWTAKQINAWERARRKISWNHYEVNQSTASIVLSAEEELPFATLMWLSNSYKKLMINNTEAPSSMVERWGFTFISAVHSIKRGEKISISAH